ncbi:hypothetical protein V473_09385 [Sphingobium cupriresistens LL01]|uniref:Uncharacterized protein n=1 Tax=Sphingobium cupriresistens LL01 TaxID=1420583 RepID=A0A0J8AXD4_9SPHN|nr:hypothetical protein V473_09385 [Sphingobium cupriresistens LL01]
MNRIFGSASDKGKQAAGRITQLARVQWSMPFKRLDRYKVTLSRRPRLEGMTHQISVPGVEIAQHVSGDERHNKTAALVRGQELLTNELVRTVSHWRYADAIMVRQRLHDQRCAWPQYPIQNILLKAPVDAIGGDRFGRHCATSPYS